MECPICKNENCNEESKLDGSHFQCPKCGEFYLSYLTKARFEKRSDLQKISHWISEQNKIFNEKFPEVTEKKVEQVLHQRDKTIREKFNLMMKALSKFSINTPIILEQLNECYIADDKEFQKLLDKMNKEGYIQENHKLVNLTKATLFWKDLTFEGHEYVESLDEPNKNSKKIFMAFWFNDDMKNVFDDVVIPRMNETEFTAERVSSKTTSHDQYISDDIIGKIKSSRAVVADCTGNRTAVYYEAGFAMGMKIPVIWTCKEGIDPDDSSNKTHMEQRCFDINQYPCIVWKDAEDLSKQLIERLRRDL